MMSSLPPRPSRIVPFADIAYLQKQQQSAAPKPVDLPENASPLLKAIARRAAKGHRRHAADAVREEATRLQRFVKYQKAKHGSKTFVFAGAHRDDGVSCVLLNLAKSFEPDRSLRVLFIDANTHSPGFSRLMGSAGLSFGLIDFLAENRTIRSVLQRSAGTEVYFIGHGRKRRDASEFLTAERIKHRLEVLQGLFDFVFIDAPPMLFSGTGSIWGNAGDGMVLVINSDRVRLRGIEYIRRRAEQQHVPIFGTVLTRRYFSVPDMIYERV